jgi:hypothetical protein
MILTKTVKGKGVSILEIKKDALKVLSEDEVRALCPSWEKRIKYNS